MPTVDELRFSLGCRYDKQLADSLKVAKQTVSKWRARGRVPDAVTARVENILLRRRVKQLGGQAETIVPKPE